MWKKPAWKEHIHNIAFEHHFISFCEIKVCIRWNVSNVCICMEITALFSFKTSKERKKLWSYLPLFSLNASSFVVWFSLRDSEKTQPSLLKSSISHIFSNQAHYFLCILWKPFCKRLFYLPKYFLKHWYIGSDMFSYLIIFVQKYTNQRNTYKKWRLFFSVCNFLWSSIHFSDKDLLQIYIGLFFSLWPNACFYDLLQNSWAWY